ncbi:hypothetical protein LCGC14_1157060 [marine sediment metagenome]|uniref:DUF3850 domain-containing protein n=1 Tax=marine sediment metagenome TaxID=412755 RepID=A0A0F9MGT8_9ZZZZ
MVHKLKTWPVFFEHMIAGRKPFDVRINDRDFRVGDIIISQEWDTIKADYTGREHKAKVTYVLKGMGLLPDYVALGLKEQPQ